MQNISDIQSGSYTYTKHVYGPNGYHTVQNTSNPVPYAYKETLTHSSYYGPRDRESIHPFSFTKVVDEPIRGHLDGASKWGDYTETVARDGDFERSYLWNPHMTADAVKAYNDGLSEFADDLRGSDLEALLVIAEGKETFSMIKEAIGALTSVRKLAKKVLAKGSLANLWLEYTYGWKPTVSDLHSYLTQEWERNPAFKARGRGKSLVETSSGNNTGIGGFSGQRTLRSTHSIRYKFGCSCRVKHPENELTAMLSNLDPTVVAWELVPYSFVVDWFVNIGQFLTTRATLANLASIEVYNAWVTQTVLQRTETEFVVSGFSGTGTTTSYGGLAKGLSEVKSLNRTVLGSALPQPKLPSFNFKGSLNQYANGLALLSQLFNK